MFHEAVERIQTSAYVPRKVSCRLGDKIFEIENYDNNERVFKGKSNLHADKELVSGTYFYVLELKEGEPVRGFLTLRN